MALGSRNVRGPSPCTRYASTVPSRGRRLHWPMQHKHHAPERSLAIPVTERERCKSSILHTSRCTPRAKRRLDQLESQYRQLKPDDFRQDEQWGREEAEWRRGSATGTSTGSCQRYCRRRRLRRARLVDQAVSAGIAGAGSRTSCSATEPSSTTLGLFAARRDDRHHGPPSRERPALCEDTGGEATPSIDALIN
jgi:hypothetical protein